MRRVFNIVSKKNGVVPFFLCTHGRPHARRDCNEGKSLDDELFEGEQMTAASRIKVVNISGTADQSCVPELPDPTACCGSGCTNCVWIEYVTELLRYHSERPLNEVLDEIDRVVPNIGVREFLKTEIRARTKCQ